MRNGQQTRHENILKAAPLATRSRRLWCFSHRTTAPASRPRKCSWTPASHKC